MRVITTDREALGANSSTEIVRPLSEFLSREVFELVGSNIMRSISFAVKNNNSIFDAVRYLRWYRFTAQH